MKITKIALVAIVSCCALACRKEPPITPPTTGYQQSVFLSVADTGVTEVYLKLSMTDMLPPRGYSIFRNGQQVLAGSLSEKDTIVVDTTAQSNTAYSYRAFRLSGTTPKDSSNIVAAQTFDTTSHAFIWEITSFGGDAGGCSLYDVAIVNDTLAYAVGEIYLKDSTTGQYDPFPFNLVTWNGSTWRLSKVPYYYQGQAFYSQIRSVFVFNFDDIWFGTANMIHWDGQNYQPIQMPSSAWGPYRINRLWGYGNELYVVGDSGSIASYNKGAWAKISSGASYPCSDISGGLNPFTGDEEIIAVASDKYAYQGATLFKITSTSAAAINGSGLPLSLQGIGFVPGQQYYAVGSGVYHKRSLTGSQPWQLYPLGTVTSYYSNAICVEGPNDVFIAGDYGEVVHFNGVSWKNYLPQTALANGGWRSIKIRGNLVIAVGDDNPKAKVLVGRR